MFCNVQLNLYEAGQLLMMGSCRCVGSLIMDVLAMWIDGRGICDDPAKVWIDSEGKVWRETLEWE